MRALFRNLEVETTSRCNLACAHCPVSMHPRPPAVLHEAVFRGIVDELAEVGFDGTFSPHFYNEPFADERLEDLVGYVARRLPAATIRIFTNTTLLTAERFRRMARHGVEEYVVSIDEDGIRRSCERLLRELTPEEGRRLTTRRIRGVAEHNRGGLVQVDGTRRPHACRIPSEYCVVDARGEVVLCFNDYFARHSFGNVARRKLLEIWRDPAFVAVRRDVARGRFDLEICRACELDAAMLPPRDLLRRLRAKLGF